MLSAAFEPSANVLRLTFSRSLTTGDVDAINPLIVEVMADRDRRDEGVRTLYDMSAVDSVRVPSSRFAERAATAPVGKLTRVIVTPPWANNDNFGSSYRDAQGVYPHSQPAFVPTLLEGYRLLSLVKPLFQPVGRGSSMVRPENEASPKRGRPRRGEEPENPKDLRNLARRVRVIASAMEGQEKARLLLHADELEALATRLERKLH